MNILVIGNGAREHAILWKLASDDPAPQGPALFTAPGNAGTAQIATNLDVKADDIDGLIAAVRAHAIDLTIVGPEIPLVAGVVDRFLSLGLRIFGPTQAASRMEGSKAFAKKVMLDAGVPTAAYRTFNDADAAGAYVREQGAPIVVKADGLAAGKGVVVATSVDEALSAVQDSMVSRVFGDAGSEVVIEECLVGQEVSVFCFTDGHSVTPLVAACDYKRIFDGDKGPNTGGMGGYSPPRQWDAALERQIREACVEPVVAQLAKQGSPFTGILYCGLMLTSDGPKVIEFNVRFGDPECQLIVPRLETRLLDVIDAVIDGKVNALDLRWSTQVSVAVVLASVGYPGSSETGVPVKGLEALSSEDLVFHAGTTAKGDAIITSGGRVLTAVGQGATMTEARARAYDTAGRIAFEGAQHRTDIANFAG
jgi:phosphoribosylamine--glycine ligase